MEVARSVRETMEEISRSFPEGISYKIPFDMTSYISQSIREVYHTLFEALLLVILVVFLSLQNWRATLIPTIAVPISLIGTFGVMLAFGFSLNMMTLLGLSWAIGIVVDDAIVVVEAVERIMNEEGYALRATKKAERTGSAITAHRWCCRRVRSRELPFGHHRPALPPVHHHDRRVGADLDVRGPDPLAGPLRPDPASRFGKRKTRLLPPLNICWARNEVLRAVIRGGSGATRNACWRCSD